MPESGGRASHYYNDWCKDLQVFHVMAADIVTKDACVYGLRITRPEGSPAFTKQERAGPMMLPHIKRALNLHLSVNQDRQVISSTARLRLS